ncbi:IgGFc-binding protein, partial [Galbibacter sp. EGI 63066]|uniref:IgGFc-binding protein n=1 Tax=Galbibacter sp. EGI 63066 TaxID=2993559 RepID=UPI002248C483
MLKKLLLLFVLLLGWVASVQAQGSLEHWLAPISRSDTTDDRGEVNITNLNTTDATVQIFRGTDLTAITTLTVPAGQRITHDLGGVGNNDMITEDASLGNVTADRGYHLVSDLPVSVDYRQLFLSGNWMDIVVSKGANALGGSFRVAVHDLMRDGQNRSDFASIMATVDGTTINVSGFTTGRTIIGVNGGNTIPVGHVETITLDRGETYTMLTTGTTTGLTGSDIGMLGALVEADQDIVLTTGVNHGRATDTDTAYDLFADQAIPVSQIGTEHVINKSEATGTTGEYVYIYAHTNNTFVFVNGEVSPIADLEAGEYIKLDQSNFTSSDNMYVRTTNPAYVYQVSSDTSASPEMGWWVVPPFLCTVPRKVLIPNVDEIRGSAFTAALHITTRSDAELFINGAPLQDYLTAGTITNYGTNDINGHHIDGTENYVTYKLRGTAITGDILVESTRDLYCGINGWENFRGSYGGFYSGFTPTINLRIDDAACLPQVLDVGDDLFDGYRWFRNNVQIEGADGPTYAVTDGGDYYVIGDIGGCESVQSNTVTVDAVPVPEGEGRQDFCAEDGPTLSDLSVEELIAPGADYELVWYDHQTEEDSVLPDPGNRLAPGTALAHDTWYYGAYVELDSGGN